MKQNFINVTHIEGYLYDTDLSIRTTGENAKNPNTAYISGTVRVATDENFENIIDVHYTFVTPTWASGKTNANYKILEDMINEKYKTVMSCGAEASKIRIDSALALNEFYVEENGEQRLVSQKRNEGGFIHMNDELNADVNKRSEFRLDMIITGCRVLEADPERELAERAILKGAAFNFRPELLPIELTVYDPRAIAYFEGAGITNKNPLFTEVRGNQVSTTIVRKIEEESAFGSSSVREVRNNRREFVVNWAKGTPYVWDDESTITAAELTELQAKRETYLATIKKRQEEYRNRSAIPAATPTSSAKDGYDF